MNDRPDALMGRAFAQARTLEPTEAEVNAVLARLPTGGAPGDQASRRPPHISGGGVLTALAVASTLAVAALAIILLGHARQSGVGRPQTGTERATNVHVPATHVLGSAVALRTELRAVRGRPIVILAWATWCAPCTKQLAVFESAVARYRHRVAFLGADIDDAQTVAKAYLAKHPVQFRNYQVTLAQLQSILGVRVVGVPTTLFISPAGKIVHSQGGSYSNSSQLMQRDLAALLREQPLTRAAPGARRLQGVSALLTENFGVFRRPVNVRPVLPSGIASGFAHSFYKQAILARTRYVALGHGVQIWLVPGSQTICMVAVGTGPPKHVWRSTGCIRIETAATSPFPWIAHAGPGSTMAFIGLVPDGATVTATTRTGATVKVPVVDNIGYVANSSGFSGVKIRYRNGRISGFTISAR